MLDDLERIQNIDSKGMLRMIDDMPEHLAAGRKAGLEVQGLAGPPSGVVICGLGGSAIGGDLARTWLGIERGLRCEVVRGYQVPGWVGAGTLAVVVSYSGDTEETLSLFEDVCDRKASVVCVASGGALASASGNRSMSCVKVPPGMVPRASFGYIFGALMGVLEASSIADPGEQFDDSQNAMSLVKSRCAMDISTAENPAKRLAHELHGFVPVVIGHGLSTPVAKRWANQLNENAKSIAFSSELPEMDHNEIVFWAADPRSQGFSGVFLDHDFSDPRMAKRLDATREMICRSSRAQVVRGLGVAPLSQMLSLLLIGDYVSFYSAMLRGEDPSTTEPIEQLKVMIRKK
jgi:glucose/mannose-6-phosphate isomerase